MKRLFISGAITFLIIAANLFSFSSNTFPTAHAFTFHDAPTSFDCTNIVQLQASQCEALVAIYNSTNGAQWLHNSGWLVTNTPCSWFGVICSGSTVMILSLSNNQLSGPIPPEIGMLPNIMSLQMSGNQLSGTIPSELWTLSPEDLILYDNQLSGELPPEIGSMSSTRIINLSDNLLSGPIPPELGEISYLDYLILNDNQFSGELPPELGSLVHLDKLRVENNQLNGSIPMSFINIPLLDEFHFYATELCELEDVSFQAWLASIPDVQSTHIICGWNRTFAPVITR